jgi:hypothetical protein
VADRGVGDDQGHAEGPLPQTGGPMKTPAEEIP